jgi:hypothetical protein
MASHSLTRVSHARFSAKAGLDGEGFNLVKLKLSDGFASASFPRQSASSTSSQYKMGFHRCAMRLMCSLTHTASSVESDLYRLGIVKGPGVVNNVIVGMLGGTHCILLILMGSSSMATKYCALSRAYLVIKD